MATSSLFHKFVLDDEETIKRFIDAFDASMDEEQPPVPDHIHIVRDRKEFEELFARQHKRLEEKRKKLEAKKNA
ncbi:MAG: hypothetical protein IJS39_03175 [Synergistaceae bacterium]|nr:hypothetical protein [Synergistaceae bacterium]